MMARNSKRDKVDPMSRLMGEHKEPRSTQGETRTELSSALKQLRVRRGLTQELLAHESGTSLGFIRKVEQGSTAIKLNVLLRLLAALGATIKIEELW